MWTVFLHKESFNNVLSSTNLKQAIKELYDTHSLPHMTKIESVGIDKGKIIVNGRSDGFDNSFILVKK